MKTFIKMLALLGLLGGLTLVATTNAPGLGCEPGKYGTLSVYDNKDYFGNVVRDGDRFVVIRFRQGDGINRPRNFKMHGLNRLEVDEKQLGYDLRGKNKNVLARHGSGDDIRWEFVRGEKGTRFKHFRVKNGELKGWWIGLGPVEQEKKGEILPRNRRGERAPLILVKDKKDAAGFRWTRPEDE